MAVMWLSHVVMKFSGKSLSSVRMTCRASFAILGRGDKLATPLGRKIGMGMKQDYQPANHLGAKPSRPDPERQTTRRSSVLQRNRLPLSLLAAGE
jgi:hypothetical protein